MPDEVTNDNVIKYGYILNNDTIIDGETVSEYILKTSLLDTLPTPIKASDIASFCDNYEIIERDDPDTSNAKIRELIYVRPNPNFNNYFITFLTKELDEFVPFEFPTDCVVTNVRFPRFQENLLEGNPVEMELEYTYFDPLLSSNIFRNDTLKLVLAIQDRALNRSNSVETFEFTLEQIRVN